MKSRRLIRVCQVPPLKPRHAFSRGSPLAFWLAAIAFLPRDSTKDLADQCQRMLRDHQLLIGRNHPSCNAARWCADARAAGATERTRKVWEKLLPLLAKERDKGVLDVSQQPSSILAHPPGYIDKDLELIVGLQTDAPLKRASCRRAVGGSSRRALRPTASSRIRRSPR